MLDAIAARGDVIGFIAYNQPHPDAVVDDIGFVIRAVGDDHVGLGSDFYGMERTPKGFETIAEPPNVTARLVERGHSDVTIHWVLGGGYPRVFGQVWRLAPRRERANPESKPERIGHEPPYTPRDRSGSNNGGETMKRALAILGAFVLLTAGGVGLIQPASVWAQTTTTPTRTEIRYFLPYDGDQVRAGLTVSGEVTGDCGEASLVIQDRPDAYFCQLADGGILDPCFANPMGTIDGPTDLVCADSPIAGDVIHLRTTEAVSSPQTGVATTGPALDALTVPWFLELANGKQCGLMRGASAAMAGMRVNLSCVGGGYVFGELDQSGAVWYANYTDQSTPDSSQVAVATVWT